MSGYASDVDPAQVKLRTVPDGIGVSTAGSCLYARLEVQTLFDHADGKMARVPRLGNKGGLRLMAPSAMMVIWRRSPDFTPCTSI